MIITITMNPSIDITYIIDDFQIGKLNRVQEPTRSIGGKGINCGRAAALSGSEVILTGFLGGKTGHLTQEFLESEALFEIDMIHIDGETRTAITVMTDNGKHTQIVEKGPYVDLDKVKDLLHKVVSLTQNRTISAICLCGSINNNDENLFIKIVDYLKSKIPNTPLLVDISEKQLTNLLYSDRLKPDFLKPNEHELAEFIGYPITTKQDAYKALLHPAFQKIPVVIASLGSNGAVAKIYNDYYNLSIPKVNIVSVTGAGDATVGGYAYALTHDYTLLDAVRYAMACGVSNVQHVEAGKINKEEVTALMTQVKASKI